MTTASQRSHVKITEAFARFGSALAYDDLPAELVVALKLVVLDTLGTTLAAGTLGAACREVVAVMQQMGGAPESTIIGFRGKVPAVNAAFANGAMAHALNFDAIGGGHLGVLVPAPLAVAERAGRVSGREYLAALAAGAEVTARINAALAAKGVNANEKFLEGQLVSTFGAAVSAGRVLRLAPDKMLSALGLALMQANGSMQVVVGGDPPAKAIYAAFPNKGGVLAALLSKEGVGAECEALEGEAGFFTMYYGGNFDASVLTEGLGERFQCLDVRFKPWPTSGALHPFVEAAMTLRSRHQLEASAIDRVHFRAGPRRREWIEPIAGRRHPANAAAAANSIPFGIAKALVNGNVTLSDFSAEGLQQPGALAIADRTGYTLDEALGGSAVIEVTTKAGERYVERVDHPLGSTEHPMSHDQLVAKFRDCVTHAVRPPSEQAVRQVIDRVGRLDELPDVSAILEPLA